MANPPFDPFGDRRPTPSDELSDLAQNIIQELKNASDIVLDAASAGKDELLRSVGEGVRAFRDSARRSAEQGRAASSRSRYTEEFTARAEEFARKRQERQAAQSAPKRSESKRRFRPVSRGSNLLLAPAVGLMVPAGVLGAVSLFQVLGGSLVSYAVPIVGLSLGLAGCVPLTISLMKKRREKLYARYLDTIAGSPSVNIRYLAAQMKRKSERCIEELQDMIKRGYLGDNARLDLSRGELILDEAAAEKLRQQQEDARKKAEAAPADTYDAMLAELQQLNILIEDEEMSEQITRIETVARATFLAVRQAPEKATQLRRFMDYYLPTTIKLLRSYSSFVRSDVEGDNIRRSKENIEGMMETLCEAFEKQYDSLFLTETMDINAEIKTMDSLLRQDGYVGHTGFGAAAAAQEKKK